MQMRDTAAPERIALLQVGGGHLGALLGDLHKPYNVQRSAVSLPKEHSVDGELHT